MLPGNIFADIFVILLLIMGAVTTTLIVVAPLMMLYADFISSLGLVQRSPRMRRWHRRQRRWAKAHQYTYRNARYFGYYKEKVMLPSSWYEQFEQFSKLPGEPTVFLQKKVSNGRIIIMEHLLKPRLRPHIHLRGHKKFIDLIIPSDIHFQHDSHYYYVVLLELDHLPQFNFWVHQESGIERMTKVLRHLPAINRYGRVYRLYASKHYDKIFTPAFMEWLKQLPTDEEVEGVPGRIIFYGKGTLDPRLLEHLHKDSHALYKLFVNPQKEPEHIMAGQYDV